MNTVFRALLCFVVLSSVAYGAQIKTENIVMPSSAGGTFSFDFATTSAPIVAAGVQLSVVASGPGTLTLDPTASSAVKNDPAYWINGNSSLSTFPPFTSGSSCVFGDIPANPTTATIDTGDKIARYAFTWSGTPGTYTFTLDSNINNTYVFLPSFDSEAITMTGGTSPYTFSVNIAPEPVSIALLGLGGILALKRRSR